MSREGCLVGAGHATAMPVVRGKNKRIQSAKFSENAFGAESQNRSLGCVCLYPSRMSHSGRASFDVRHSGQA
jgi:hypothetical protein